MTAMSPARGPVALIAHQTDGTNFGLAPDSFTSCPHVHSRRVTLIVLKFIHVMVAASHRVSPPDFLQDLCWANTLRDFFHERMPCLFFF